MIGAQPRRTFCAGGYSMKVKRNPMPESKAVIAAATKFLDDRGMAAMNGLWGKGGR